MPGREAGITGCHFIGQCAGDYHKISLTWTSTKDDTKSIHIIAKIDRSNDGLPRSRTTSSRVLPWRSHMHHFHSTASQTEGQRPYRTTTNQVLHVVETCKRYLCFTIAVEFAWCIFIGREVGNEVLFLCVLNRWICRLLDGR
jgi:hypothetical protein